MEDNPSDTLAPQSHPKLNCVAEQPWDPLSAANSTRANGQLWIQTARTAQWSPDGTCLLTTSANNTLETIILPTDLLTSNSFHKLTPYSSLTTPDPIFSTAAYPHFNLEDPNTALLLHASRENPIKLTNALSHEAGSWGTYPLVSPTTEQWIAPHSLLFTLDGTHFVAGSTAMFVVFDISRYGEGPVEIHKTGRRKRGGGHYSGSGLDFTREVTGANDIISTMDISCDETLAIGTWGRRIGIYSHCGRGELITSFSPADVEAGGQQFGQGISQVKWSPCGRYIYVAERRSGGIHVYDIRGAGKRIGHLVGREAQTNAKLAFDLVPTADGCEVWAGGTDGKVRMWKNPHLKGGVVSWEEEWQVHGERDLVCATLMHGTGCVVATVACGERYNVETGDDGSESDLSGASEDDESESESDSEDEEVLDKEGEDSRTLSAAASEDSRRGESYMKIWSIS